MNKRTAFLLSIVILYSNTHYCVVATDELHFKKLTRPHNLVFEMWISSAPAAVCELLPDTDPDTIDWVAIGEEYGALLTTDQQVVSRALDLGLPVYHFNRYNTQGWIIILNTHDRKGMIEWITTS